jgi:transposase InsO family protein
VVDLIVKLPLSQGYDSILTVTDYGCSKAAVMIPCHEATDVEGMAQLYGQYVFPHFGIPKSIISDRDPRFAANFTRELCCTLKIQQNISTAYHPQTNGQSERTNQWLEQYLRIFVNHRQDNWV